LSYSNRIIQERAEARAQKIQEELEDDEEEAEFEREMEAIQARNRRKMSIFSSSSVGRILGPRFSK
jgi:hypothetical protein